MSGCSEADVGAVRNGSQVSYIGHDSSEIPELLGRKYGDCAKRLDLSFNKLRYFVLHKLTHLKFLDTRQVTKRELQEAVARGTFMKVMKPQDMEDSSDAAPPSPGLPYSPLPSAPRDLTKHRGRTFKDHPTSFES